MILIASLLVLMTLLQGCASGGGSPKYSSASMGVAHTLETGIVVSAQRVVVDGHESGWGTYAGLVGGGAVGSALGAEVGGTALSTAVGGAAGMIGGVVAGPKIEKKLNSTKADELTIEMDNGKMIVLIQPIREPEFYSGERVRVHKDSYGNSKVFHIDEDPYLNPNTSVYLPSDFDHGLIDQNSKKSSPQPAPKANF